ncbi:biopolymer transporter ExbD [Ruficoccus amylovorans]|uniref:Biopolymer transporter ExbD n=1 Tax=Ruficoccus amylovorans TaxID=1804625 RepID=A0A842HKS8_9BACT|nr:biopolymer transporter ExbD [Ruficoccus amylovorans]MBC2596077.1 biopolymer transporter ExbD [Ruficoccus amylovorans]
MARKRRASPLAEEDKTDLTPMIDVVFLLLAFFMVTTNFQEEADLGLRLPANVPPPKNVELPNEHVVDIMPSGDVYLNGAPMDSINSRTMPELVNTLKRLKTSADRSEIQTSVTIVAAPASLHQRSIDVLNACAAAQIKYVSFAAE